MKLTIGNDGVSGSAADEWGRIGGPLADVSWGIRYRDGCFRATRSSYI